ncbi:MAG: hypothetical protein ACM3NQ_16385 [Bacteroidales bacterium]
MQLTFKASLVTTIATLLAAGPGVVQAQKGNKALNPPILLEATFDPLHTGIVADGAYQTTNQSEVQIDSDGNLRFEVRERAGRSVFLDFTLPLRLGTAGAPIPGPTDPVPQWSLFTMLVGGAPIVDLRTMAHLQVAPVRLWFTFTTRTDAFFRLQGDPDTQPLKAIAGPVQVTALDENGSGKVDCWIFEPLPGTDSKFKLSWGAAWKGGQGWIYVDTGDYQLPFRIVFRDVAGR